jgi:hypothetical protein
MANTIRIRRSSVASAVPTTTQLALGELAINTNDGKLFLKRNNGTESIVEVGAGGGGGATPAGSSGQVQFNNAGAFGADADLTWNGSTNTLSVAATPGSSGAIDLGDYGGVNSNINYTEIASGANYVRCGNTSGEGVYITGPIKFDVFNRQFQYTVSGAGKVATLPDNTGGLIGTGDVGTVTSTMIAPGTVLKSNYGQVLAVQYGAAMP